MAIITSLQALITRRFELWLARRIPRASTQAINHKNIFIMPSRFGVVFVFFALLVFLLGTNYQNNIIILTSYLLISFFIIVLLHSFYNLSGLRFSAPSAIKGFVDSSLAFPLVVSSDKTRFNVKITFLPVNIAVSDIFGDKSVATMAEIKPGDNEVFVPFTPKKRGQYALERVTIVSEYGFGLFRTWTRLDFAQQILAYPKPIAFDLSVMGTVDSKNDKVSSTAPLPERVLKGNDDFYQLQQYRVGEPKSRIAWKQVARGQGWLTKHYRQEQGPDILLDLNAMPSADIETRLGMLCFAVCEQLNQQLDFSLQLPNALLRDRASSKTNLAEFGEQCLALLASYQHGCQQNNQQQQQAQQQLSQQPRNAL